MEFCEKRNKLRFIQFIVLIDFYKFYATVNQNKVEFTGTYPTVIISHKDVPGAVSKVTKLLYEDDVNIAFMKVFRSQRGKEATMVFEVDYEISNNILDKIKEIDEIKSVIVINPVKDGE